MFTWICPQCGREVPPSYSECPNCAENRARGMAPGAQAPQQAPAPQPPPPPPQAYPVATPPQPQYAPPQYPVPPQQQYAPPQQPVYAPPPQQQYAPPPQQQYAPPPPPPPAAPAWQDPQIQHSQAFYTVGEQKKKKTPLWLVMVGTAALLGVVLFALYRYVDGGANSGTSEAIAAKKEAAAPPGTHPYAKFVELTGFRISEDGKKVKVQYLVVNHSAASLAGLEMQVTLTTVNAKPEDPPLGEFTAKVGDVEPFGSKEMSDTFPTKLRAYELPDWQFLKATFSITAPR